MEASLEELIETDDVGDITAQSIYEFFKQEQTIDLISMQLITMHKRLLINQMSKMIRC